MIIVINVRGLKSNSIFDLYGMQTRANSVSDDGNVCIYNAKKLMKLILIYVLSSKIKLFKSKHSHHGKLEISIPSPFVNFLMKEVLLKQYWIIVMQRKKFIKIWQINFMKNLMA